MGRPNDLLFWPQYSLCHVLKKFFRQSGEFDQVWPRKLLDWEGLAEKAEDGPHNTK